MSQAPGSYKKWCEYCRLMIYAKEFNDHCKSRRHIKNKENELKFQQQKNRKLRIEKEKAEQKGNKSDLLKDIEKRAKLSMAEDQKDSKQMRNILTNNDDGELENAIRKDYDPDSFMARADYSKTMISDQVYNDIQGNLKGKLGKVWEIREDQKAGKLYFYNNMTKEKKDSKPFGLKLSKDENEIWNNYIRNDDYDKEYFKQQREQQEESEQEQEQGSDSEGEENDSEADRIDDEIYQKLKNQEIPLPADKNIGRIQGQWEIVEDEEDFFQANAAQKTPEILSSEEDQQDEEDRYIQQQRKKQLFKEEPRTGAEVLDEAENFAYEEKQTLIDQTADKLDQGEYVSEKQMFEAIIQEQIDQEGGQLNKVKLKNDKLRTLVEKNIDLPTSLQKNTFQKRNFLDDGDNDKKVEKKGFKKRVLNDKKTKKIDFDMD